MSWLTKRRGSQGVFCGTIRRDSGHVLHEGWATKESGSAMFGKTNWRKRWFRLAQRENTFYLEYYRSSKDNIPAGYVKLDVTYCTRPVESSEKSYPNCFAVGPIFDDGATRTYYISCVKEVEMREWMAVIDAVIQGAPEDARRRKETVNTVFSIKYKDKLQRVRDKVKDGMRSEEWDERTVSPDQLSSGDFEKSTSLPTGACVESVFSVMIPESLTREEIDDDEMMDDIADEIEEGEEDTGPVTGASALSSAHRILHNTPDNDLSPEEKRTSYVDTSWRLKQWETLCSVVQTSPWVKSDTKDGVTVSRCRFGRSSRGYAVFKVEGLLPTDPRNVFNFLKLSTRQGGKLDYLFRNEYIVQEVTNEPKATIIYNEFQPPLPRVSVRDVVAMKIWIPQTMSTTDKFGFVMFSVQHPDVPPPEKGYTRIGVDHSGMLLSLHPGPKNEPHTKLTIIGQIAFYGAMHKMLKGAYNSGLLKLGFRTTFSLINEQLERYLDVTNI